MTENLVRRDPNLLTNSMDENFLAGHHSTNGFRADLPALSKR